MLRPMGHAASPHLRHVLVPQGYPTTSRVRTRPSRHLVNDGAGDVIPSGTAGPDRSGPEGRESHEGTPAEPVRTTHQTRSRAPPAIARATRIPQEVEDGTSSIGGRGWSRVRSGGGGVFRSPQEVEGWAQKSWRAGSDRDRARETRGSRKPRGVPRRRRILASPRATLKNVREVLRPPGGHRRSPPPASRPGDAVDSGAPAPTDLRKGRSRVRATAMVPGYGDGVRARLSRAGLSNGPSLVGGVGPSRPGRSDRVP